MRKDRIERCALFFLWFFSMCMAAGRADAGQVVTEDVRQWARQVIAQENSLQAQTGTKAVSILYFDNQTQRPELDPLQKGLAVMLITDLSKIDTIQVVERVKIQALLDELKLGTTGLVDQSTAPRVGRLVGAAYIVGGRLEPAKKDAIRIDSNLLSVARQNSIGQPASSGPFEELLRMEKEIAFEIVRLLGLELTPAQIEELRKPLTTNLNSLMLWFQGINLSDKKDYNKAADAYQSALKIDPAFKPAQSTLEELRALHLIARPPDTMQVLERLRQQVSVNDRPEPDDISKRDHSAAAQAANVTVRWH
ncbi:MAG: hypothetical protein M0036_13845 [Desulfobacteraceae bacterium]|nr:hypothetical protein [Desulfobacteraceae bacterium]